MKPAVRYSSQLLFRKSYKPNRIIRFRPVARVNLEFGRVPAGPKTKIYEYKVS